MPLFIWNSPLPRGDALLTRASNGDLERWVKLLAARGIVPTVRMGHDWTPAGALALAKAISAAGQPVYLLIPTIPGDEAGLYPGGDIGGSGRAASPCFMDFDTSTAARTMRSWLQPLKDAGITVKGVWFDYEGEPKPSRAAWAIQKSSVTCRDRYPSDVLDDYDRWSDFIYNLRSRILSEAVADPIHELFPAAIVGNYNETASSTAKPFVATNGNRVGNRTIGALTAQMPIVYADNRLLGVSFPGASISQERADEFYFPRMLRAASSSFANAQSGKLNVPYISRYVPARESNGQMVGLSQGLYRELLRHVLLRGADGLFIFNISTMARDDALDGIADSVAVYDEMLAYSDILTGGTPLDFSTPEWPGAVWSGVRGTDRALIRALTPAGSPQTVSVPVFAGVTVRLEAPVEGATYIVDRSGRVTKVASGRI
jgi:hypothetical protein